jgi:signal transduction histidine kinase
MISGRLAFVGSILLALTITLGLTVLIMRPPARDVLQLALVFGATGLGASLLGFISHRLGWWQRASSLTQSLTVGHLLAALVGLIIVLVAAGLMFINKHDLTLAGLLLLFASSVAVSFGYFLSNSITERLKELEGGARRLSEGDFGTRVNLSGKDEVAQLGRAFNRMAERLEQAEAESARLEAARRDFIAAASHDLRTPLTSLRAMLDAIADGVVEQPDEYIQRSLRVVAQLTSLTDDLVELAQLDSGGAPLQRSLGSIAQIVQAAIEDSALRAEERGIRLAGAAPPNLKPLLMAEDKIARVLQNLLDNAIRHTGEGGEVQVEVRENNGMVEVSVRDNGEGIPPEHLAHVFERFYRGDKSRSREGMEKGGVGLGLAIAKELVEGHGGRIWVESAPAHGTRITFALPRDETGVG